MTQPESSSSGQEWMMDAVPHGAPTIDLVHGDRQEQERRDIQMTLVDAERALNNYAKALGRLAGDHRFFAPDELSGGVADLKAATLKWAKATIYPHLYPTMRHF
jgi:hypothetical protein